MIKEGYNFKNLLFVCTGNVYRSFISERAFNLYAKKVGYKSFSRGISPYYKKPHGTLINMCNDWFGKVFDNHKARVITQKDIGRSSLIVAIDKTHYEYVAKNFKNTGNKLILFQELFQISEASIKDFDYKKVSRNNAELVFKIVDIVNSIKNFFNEPNCTVIIPVHNEEKNIKTLLNELVRQNVLLKNAFKFIVVSSGSTDSTDNIVSDFKKQNIVLITESARRGKISALKIGVKNIDTQYTTMIDGDIAISSDFLNNILVAIKKNPSYMFTGKVKLKTHGDNFFNKISEISTDSWNTLREETEEGYFLYPTGYCMGMPTLYLKYALHIINKRDINDDAMIGLYLFKAGKSFKYNPQIVVSVKFPQNLKDFFIQKVRTRLGRIENSASEFYSTERRWRNLIFEKLISQGSTAALSLLILDFFCRIMANYQFYMRSKNSDHFMWRSATSTK